MVDIEVTQLLQAGLIVLLGFLLRALFRQSPNVAENVEDQYDRIADQYDDDWALYVNSTVEAAISQFKAQFTNDELQSRSLSVLDIGCGTGAFVAGLAERYPNWSYTGVDLSENMLKRARKKHPSFHFVKASAEDLSSFEDSSFDIVITLSSLHFWDNPAMGLREAKRVSKKYVIVSDWAHDFLSCKFCGWYLWFRGFAKNDWSILSSKDLKLLFSMTGLTLKSPIQLYQIDLHPLNYKFIPKWGMMFAVGIKNDIAYSANFLSN